VAAAEEVILLEPQALLISEVAVVVEVISQTQVLQVAAAS
jgi:hypothetical protein